jgi:hypothetical protein
MILNVTQTGAPKMFRNAIAIAQQYTQPVVLSRRAANGKCSSNIGSFVIINDDGWILTAGYIISIAVPIIGNTGSCVMTTDRPWL